MNQSDKNELSLDEFLRVMDVATTIRQKDEEVVDQLDFDKTKEGIRQRLRETAKVTGETLTDSQIEAAVNNYFGGLYSFNAPERDFETKLAEVYVERGRLTRKYVMCPLAIATCIAGIVFAFDQIKTAMLRSEEERVEVNIKGFYYIKNRMLSEVESLFNSPFLAQLPKAERDRFDSFTGNIQRNIRSTDAFFNQYCSDGTPEDDITVDNFKEADLEFQKVKDLLIKTDDEELNNSKSIISTQEGLVLLARNMGALMKEIEVANPHKALYNKAAQFYSAGQGEIERRNLEGARQNETGLEQVRDGLLQFSDLTSKIDALYGNITSVAVEAKALQKGESLYKEAKQFAESADVPKLSQSVYQLEDLAGVLNQEYTIRIVSKPGERSVIARSYDEGASHQFSGWYLVLEAIGSDGKIVPLKITDFETGKTEIVTMWGEKVEGPADTKLIEKIKNTGRYDRNSLLQRTIKDKIDDGIINDNLIGRKERGYLDYKLDNPHFLGVKITRW